MKKILVLAAFLAFALSATLYAAGSINIEIGNGDSVAIRCTADVLRVTQDNPVSALAICGANATATPAPLPTDTPEPAPTPTPTHDHGMEEADLRWHTPGAHGDRPAHEHGDAPPQWVLDAGYDPTYTHVGGTPNENHAYYKHTAFKGYAGQFGNQQWYAIFHLDFNPGGHVSRFHSYQLWVRDTAGGVSHFHGWLDFGTGEQTGPNLVIVCGQASNVRPIIMANQAGCPSAPLFETWYARAGGSGDWAPDFGFSVSPNYYAGGDPANPATWTPVNPWPSNLTRRVEFAIPADRLAAAPKGDFWATQWGRIVSGPSDPICGTPRTVGERTYTTVCLMQTIQSTLQPIQFPGNAVQRTFPGNGVQLPN